MTGSRLEIFRKTSPSLDFLTPMAALLEEFRHGNIADRHRVHEDAAIRSHLGGLAAAWDEVFPRFPDQPWKRRSFSWEFHRGRRDVYLRGLIAASVPAELDGGSRLIVNPAAVVGRHARALAHVLPDHEILGSDIDDRGDRVYQYFGRWKYPGQRNYRFVRENIFEPETERRPAAVVFFGACGAVSDGCMDYAIATHSPFIICRTCCHDNIAGNTQIVRRPSLFNAFFNAKNWGFARYKKKGKGFYFCERYAQEAYPRSRAARELMNSDTILAIAQNAVDSDICRSLIDLDRCLYLRENGYDVMYREELFFAHKRREIAKG